jgi:hypothetical protein
VVCFEKLSHFLVIYGFLLTVHHLIPFLLSPMTLQIE